MQVFHIRYRNAQGALMRILNAGLSPGARNSPPFTPEYAGQDHAVTLLLDVSQKQDRPALPRVVCDRGCRRGTSSTALHEHEAASWAPASAGFGDGRAVRRAQRWLSFQFLLGKCQQHGRFLGKRHALGTCRLEYGVMARLQVPVFPMGAASQARN